MQTEQPWLLNATHLVWIYSAVYTPKSTFNSSNCKIFIFKHSCYMYMYTKLDPAEYGLKYYHKSNWNFFCESQKTNLSHTAGSPSAIIVILWSRWWSPYCPVAPNMTPSEPFIVVNRVLSCPLDQFYCPLLVSLWADISGNHSTPWLTLVSCLLSDRASAGLVIMFTIH